MRTLGKVAVALVLALALSGGKCARDHGSGGDVDSFKRPPTPVGPPVPVFDDETGAERRTASRHH